MYLVGMVLDRDGLKLCVELADAVVGEQVDEVQSHDWPLLVRLGEESAAGDRHTDTEKLILRESELER